MTMPSAPIITVIIMLVHMTIPTYADSPAQALNRFGWTVFQATEDSGDNLCISPYSIFSALAMTAVGAAGETRDEMTAVLTQAVNDAALEPEQIRALNQTLFGDVDPDQMDLLLANAVFAQDGMPIEPVFVETLSTAFSATFDAMPFATDPAAALDRINAWADRHTAGRIPRIIPDGGVTRDTRMVLANALYFKGAWRMAFDKARTQTQPFFTSAEESIPTPMMYQRGTFDYVRNDVAEMIELPYAGGELALSVVLPRPNLDLSDMEQSISYDTVRQWISDMQPREIIIHLPRFVVESSMTLGRELRTLGMRRAFGGQADFSGIAGPPGAICISDVWHRTWIDVNEEGTEAAAVTAVGIMMTSMPPDPPPVFRADRPFLFILRSQTTGAILFLGRVTTPEAAAAGE